MYCVLILVHNYSDVHHLCLGMHLNTQILWACKQEYLGLLSLSVLFEKLDPTSVRRCRYIVERTDFFNSNGRIWSFVFARCFDPAHIRMFKYIGITNARDWRHEAAFCKRKSISRLHGDTRYFFLFELFCTTANHAHGTCRCLDTWWWEEMDDFESECRNVGGKRDHFAF